MKPKSLETTIRKSLKKLNYDYEKQLEKDKAYLLQVETVIQNIFDRELKAKDLLTKNNVSIKNISEKTGIARQTLYNNPILIEYINVRNQDFKPIDISVSNNNNEEEIKILKKELAAMHTRDCEIEELKIQIKELREKITVKDRTIKSLYQQKGIHI